MSVASSLSSIAEKLTSVLSKINTKLVEKGATEAATFNDVDSKLDEISTGNISVDGSFQVVAVDGAAYGFEKQADEYWKSTNKGVSSSCSVCKVVFNMNTDGTAVFDCINYAEAGYDYGVIGKVDTELSITNINDTSDSIAKSFKDSSSSSVQTYSMVIPSGEHFVYVKYRKDNSKDENDDVFKFKVSIDSSAATSADILYGKKAYVNGALVEGTIQTKTGQQGSTITSNGTTSIPQGYHDGGSYVSVNVSTTTTIPTDGDAATSDVLTGKTFYSGGSKKTGTMTNRGAWTSTATSNGSVTIPAGYHNGSGKVTVNVASSSAASYTQTKLSTSVSSSVSSFVVSGLPDGLSDSDIAFIYLIRYGVKSDSVGSVEVISGMVNNLSSTCAVNIVSANGRILCRDSVEDGTVIEITRSGTTLTVRSESFKFNGNYYIYVIHKSA